MEKQGKNSCSSSSNSSSIDSSSHPPATISPAATCSSSCSSSSRRDNLRTTDLKLGVRISQNHHSTTREEKSNWPPIKPFLRNALLAAAANSSNNENQNHHRLETLFVKVYMEGILIGRKLDLLAHSNYPSLITKLSQMFRTTILLDLDLKQSASSFNNKTYVLTYEDKEGDWMMVGDVPWELFLTTVKRLKITRADKC